MNALLDIPLPGKNTQHLRWGQLPGASLPYVLFHTAQQAACPVLVIAQNAQQMHAWYEACCFFNTKAPSPISLAVFPDWEILPYDHFSPQQDIISERLRLLAELPHQSKGILFITANTLLTRLPPVDYLSAHAFSLQLGHTMHVDRLRQRLQEYGYYCVNTVMNHGEYAVRGSLFDVFPMGGQHPLRIDLLDDTVDSIRCFDPDSQRSTKTVQAVRILPAHEYPLDEQAITRFRTAWRQQWEGKPTDSPIYQAISKATPCAGIEYYLPLFYEKMATLFAYLPAETLIMSHPKLRDHCDFYWQEIEKRYHQCQGDLQRPLLEPHALFLQTNILSEHINQFCRIEIQVNPLEPKTGRHNFATQPLPELTLAASHKTPLAPLQQFLQQQPHCKVLFCAETAGRLERLQDLLKSIEITPRICTDWFDFLSQPIGHYLIIAPFDQGVMFSFTSNTLLITEADLLGQPVIQRRRRKTTELDSDLLVRNLNELTLGAPVTHLDHGVGRYLGLQTLTINETPQEFLLLEYAGSDKLYVPVTSMHLISRYSAAALEHAPLHRLGSEQWERAKQKAAKKAHDVAAELLAVEAQRQLRQSVAYAIPKEEYTQFAASFPFEETPDQEQAIAAVLDDLNKTQATDRLICGDVGFGKTEVAMRATFLVAYHGKQVAVLVPTTLLAQQHYESFQNRFAEWPVRIAMLSRFNSAKEQSNIVTQMAEGTVDIVIGTHKLLQPTIQFKRLGLIVIDEEHRFGVRHKEQLKRLRAEVDILTLTATPIPRTLNMAMAGMRDISLIATPPARRLSIRTFVHEHQKSLVREALLREILRGGQVYYLHNKVATIDRTAEQLADWVPEARIKVAHGKMPERELEQIMKAFYHQEFNVLICTTIIETGIDIPTANTIVIDRADCFGLAQLHQLRGRVGRSHHQAYAYLLVSSLKALTQDAKKRLDAITRMEELGAGFSLASHDLEIRGAGELLGDEQSGQMQEIGFSLYMELLNRTIKAIQSGQDLDLNWGAQHSCEIDLKFPALIPDDYLADVHLRLVLYKRLASAPDPLSLDELRVELIDRFGPLPEPTKNLITVTALKLKAQALGIVKILLHQRGGSIEFGAHPNFAADRLIALIQGSPQHYQMQGGTTLKLRYEKLDAEQRVKVLEALFYKLSQT